VLAVEVTSFDLRFGGGVVRDRYLFYVVPVVLVALAAMRRPALARAGRCSAARRRRPTPGFSQRPAAAVRS
jgi:hypothetical protein